MHFKPFSQWPLHDNDGTGSDRSSKTDVIHSPASFNLEGGVDELLGQATARLLDGYVPKSQQPSAAQGLKLDLKLLDGGAAAPADTLGGDVVVTTEGMAVTPSGMAVTPSMGFTPGSRHPGAGEPDDWFVAYNVSSRVATPGSSAASHLSPPSHSKLCSALVDAF